MENKEEILHIPKEEFERFYEQSKSTVEEKDKLKEENQRLKNDLQFSENQLGLATDRIDSLEDKIEEQKKEIEALRNNKPVPINMGKYFAIFAEHGKVEEPRRLDTKGLKNEC